MLLKVIHTSQFQLANLGNNTRKKTLVCKKWGGGSVAGPVTTQLKELQRNFAIMNV